MLQYTASRAEIGVLAPEHAGGPGVYITNTRRLTNAKINDVGGYGWCCGTWLSEVRWNGR